MSEKLSMKSVSKSSNNYSGETTKMPSNHYDGILNNSILFFPLYMMGKYSLDLGYVFETEILHCNRDNHNLWEEYFP